MQNTLRMHIGKKIKEIVEKRGITKTELARRLNMTSSNVHKIFTRESIDTSLLLKLSEILEHDFFQYYYKDDQPVKMVCEDAAPYNAAVSSKEAEQYKTKLMERDAEIIRLQKRMIKLMEGEKGGKK